jgi:aminopeptidase N
MRRLLVALGIAIAVLAACQPVSVSVGSLPSPAAARPAAADAGQATPMPLVTVPATSPAITATAGVSATTVVTHAVVTSGTLPSQAASLAAPWDEWAVYQSALRPAGDAGSDPAAKAVLEPAPGALAGMTQYHLALTLYPDLTRLDGRAKIRYTNRSGVALDSIYLHLFPNLWSDGMTVSDVSVAGQPVSVTLASTKSLARVLLLHSLAPGDSVELALSFTDPIPAGRDLGNYGEFALQDGVLALAGFYPTVVVYDDQGWHLETPATLGDVLYADASLYDVTLTAPANLTVAATGSTQDRKDNGDGSTTWRLVGGPMRDFNIVAGADYQRVSKPVGDVTVNSYALTKDSAGGRSALDWAAKALETYQSAFGPYPYRELDVVETPTTAGGIEYPGLVVVAEMLYSNPQRRDFFESATAHEVAHQWWYNVVGDDQVNNPWVDEAMAQYSTGLYYGDAHGAAAEQAFDQSLDRRWSSVGREDKPIGLPVASYSENEYSAIVYGRGPLFLIALRDQIGKDKMAEFLRRYYQQYAWDVARPADFQKLAEEVSGQDLSALFNQWVYPKK